MRIRLFLFLFLIIGFVSRPLCQSLPDTSGALLADSAHTLLQDTLPIEQQAEPLAYSKLLGNVLTKNKYIELKAKPVYFISAQKSKIGKEFLFYFIITLLLFLGFYKTMYGKYLNNIFRVFFNTSLRHNQLTDILRQSKLPSLILNIFFTIVTGFYLWLIFDHYNIINDIDNRNILVLTILLVAVVFALKFCVLKFTGWVTGMSDSTDVYIFIIFLINKIIGLFLIPVVILLSFSSAQYVKEISVFSFLIIGFLILLQVFRSYGLLQTQLKINWIHFLIYIIGFEVVPYVIIFKWAATLFLNEGINE